MSKLYKAVINFREALPRSKRLRKAGVSSSGGSTVVAVNNDAASGDGHTHDNLGVLDKLSMDEEGYICTRQEVVIEDNEGVDGTEDVKEEEETEKETVIKDERAKVGYADKAGDLDLSEDSGILAKLGKFFLRKDIEDIAQKIINFVLGITFGRFVKGSTGAGIYKDEQGDWHFEGDFFHVRKKLTAEEIEVQRTTHIGGKLMNTAAGMICSKVEEHDTYWRCFFKTEDADGRKVYNQFRVKDQAYVETFNLTKQADGTLGNHYLWRLVINVGTDYIDLSKSDCAIDSDAPLEEDNIVQLGNRTDASRQGAIIEAAAGDGSPYFRIYKGINSYTLPAPKIDLNPDESRICAKFISVATGKDLEDSIKDIEVNLGIVKEQTDKEYTIWFYDYAPTLNNIPASDWETADDKKLHDQDLFYNRTTGLAYRFENGAWVDITDQYTIKALENAAKAQDTADGKRRVFVSQPTASDEYDVGDMWVNVTYGSYENDELVCVTAKKKGASFSISHWKPSSNATTAYIENKGNEILLAVSNRIANAESLADSAYDEALYALGIARGAQSDADDNASAIRVNRDSIAVVSGRFNADGTIKNTSGLVTTADFASLFATEKNAAGLVTEARVNVLVKDGISNISLSADQIKLEGYTTINGGFSIDKYGNVTMEGGFMGNVTINGSLNTSSSSGKQIYINPDTSSITFKKENASGSLKTYVEIGFGIQNSNNSGYLGLATRNALGESVYTTELFGAYVKVRDSAYGKATEIDANHGLTLWSSSIVTGFSIKEDSNGRYVIYNRYWPSSASYVDVGGVYLDGNTLKVRTS
jgi:hypothetical protein|nr:MAG TPA: tail protein [Caudoviricetes sp.]